MRSSCTPLLEPPDDDKVLSKHMQGVLMHVVYIYLLCAFVDVIKFMARCTVCII
jgi:hypothetical protein